MKKTDLKILIKKIIQEQKDKDRIPPHTEADVNRLKDFITTSYPNKPGWWVTGMILDLLDRIIMVPLDFHLNQGGGSNIAEHFINENTGELTIKPLHINEQSSQSNLHTIWGILGQPRNINQFIKNYTELYQCNSNSKSPDPKSLLKNFKQTRNFNPSMKEQREMGDRPPIGVEPKLWVWLVRIVVVDLILGEVLSWDGCDN